MFVLCTFFVNNLYKKIFPQQCLVTVMASTEFLRKTFQGKKVDMYCASCGWVCGTLKECANGVVTLLGRDGPLTFNIDSILSVTHAQNI
jgi:hypothetical protein